MSLQGNQQLCSLDKTWLLLLTISIFVPLVASRLLNLDSFCDKTHIVCVAIPNELLGGNDTNRGRVAKSVKNEIFMVLKSLFAKIDIKGLILSVRHIDLVRFNFEVLVTSSWCLICGLIRALHDCLVFLRDTVFGNDLEGVVSQTVCW